jgi:opacity protein-like surface antigen
MKKYTKLFVGTLCAALLASSAFAADTVVSSTTTTTTVERVEDDSKGEWSLTLGGTGSTLTKGSNTSNLGVDISIGHTGHLILPLEAGIRQNVSFGGSDNSTVLVTRAYSDWDIFKIGKLDFFLGGNVGLAYGNTPLTWTAGPEGGVRYWIAENVAAIGRVDYLFNLNNGTSNNALGYFLGLQVRF